MKNKILRLLLSVYYTIAIIIGIVASALIMLTIVCVILAIFILLGMIVYKIVMLTIIYV